MPRLRRVTPQRRVRMYRCWKCREPMKVNLNSVGLQCERCGSKIFYKERPNTTKSVRAR